MPNSAKTKSQMFSTSLPTLVFDLDGTLAETAPDIMGTLNFLLLQEGLQPLPVEAARQLVGQGARVLLQRGFAHAGHPLDDAHLERLFERFLAHYFVHLADESHLYPAVTKVLAHLQARGFRLAICTNKPEKHARKLVELLGVEPLFAFVAGRETFPFSKPAPQALWETIRQAGGESEYAIMIGDSITDIQTARAANLPVIGVTFGYSDRPMAELSPDKIITHFEQLEDAIVQLL